MPLFPDFSAPSPSVWGNQPVKKKSFFKRMIHFFTLFFCFIGFLFSLAVGIRFYSLTHSSPAVFEPGTVLRLNLENELFETRPTDFIGSLTFGNPPTIADVILGLHRAANDPNVSGLVAYMTKTSLSLTQIQEIRSAVKAFKKAGKRTVFYAPTIGELGGGLGLYYLASAFDEIRIQPGGEVGLAGMAIETPYFKKALLNWGIKPSFNARYEYKAGADSLNAEKMSEPEKENLTNILNSFLDTMAIDIAQDRPALNKAEIRQILENGPYFADQALKMKLIDKVEYADVLETELKERQAEIVDVFDYSMATAPVIKHKEAVIAYIPAVGIIQFGESLFGGDSYRSILGFSSFSSSLREAADDEQVKAIVIRLDSPGGGYTPSDAMRREIEYVKTVSQKPIICSMGSTAASGGYFVSLGCDKVFADPATLTGSIGVFGGKLVFKDLLKKLDITVSSLKMGKNAGLFSMAQDFSEEQKKFFNDSLDRVYRDFTQKVARRRGFSEKQIDVLARGRVFTGAQAKANGLIDETGGIADSFAEAAKAANLTTPARVVEFPVNPTRLEMLISLLNSDAAVYLKKSILQYGIFPRIKLWFDKLSQGDLRLFYDGLKAF